MPTKVRKIKKVKGYAVICPESIHVSAYTNWDRADERKNELNINCGLKHKIISCTITYHV